MSGRQDLAPLFEEHGYTDFRWIDPRDVVIAQWVRMKCTYGCSGYGTNASCPPNNPSVAECRQLFDEYRTCAIFHFEVAVKVPEDRRPWLREANRELLKLERAAFLAGFPKAFLMFMDPCHLCADCPGVREECREPQSARPSPEGMAVDVFSTVRKVGYPIEVLTDYSQPMNRYAFLLIE